VNWFGERGFTIDGSVEERLSIHCMDVVCRLLEGFWLGYSGRRWGIPDEWIDKARFEGAERSFGRSH